MKWPTAVLLVLICAYGAVLRLDALTDRYGPVQQPAWARVLTTSAPPLARHLEPAQYAWPRYAVPYVGGDPASYLKFAREMRSFYQAHVREPMFLAITRGWLRLFHDQGIAISFASGSMSTLVILATFLLGRAAFSTPVGLLAALAFALDYDAVMWAPDGWRDDTFTAFFVFSSWALVRLRQEATAGRATAAGALGAAACLTRITSLTWLAPGLAAIGVLSQREHRAARWRAVAIAAAVTALLVAPYLVNCARAYGDPLVSINVHTGYYRNGEGIDPTQPLSARAYIGGKLARSPVRQLDTAATGIFVLPLRNKFGGFDDWIPGLAGALRALAAAGLVIWLFSPVGRLLTVVWITALLPYAFTWNIGDGRAWRFTMHVYPLFLIAAFSAVQLAIAAVRTLRRDGWPRRALARHLVGAGAVLGAAALVTIGYGRLPYYASAESVRHGEEETIAAGERDGVFFASGWSQAMTNGNVTSRVVLGDRAIVRVPLPPGRAYRLTLRLDPACPDAPGGGIVLAGGQVVGRIGLGFNPSRVGSYEVYVPPQLARGNTKLQFVADGTVPAGRCGPLYAGFAPGTPISLRVWYVRIHPS